MVDKDIYSRSPISGMSDIYGGVGGQWSFLKKGSKKAGQENILKSIESNPTCQNSSFLREPNIRIISSMIGQRKTKSWHVLEIGCGTGQEPYELALRLASNGIANFNIDAVDVSEDVIKVAKSGVILDQPRYSYDPVGDFLAEMEKAKLVSADSVNSGYLQVSSDVMTHISFHVRDIIDAPFLEGDEKAYNVALCNNVLQHYPVWTRELILTNILKNMKNGSLLALDEDQENPDPETALWLEPYQEWKGDLNRFGLTRMKTEKLQNIYRYNQKANQFLGERYAIRDREMVEIK